MTVFNYTAARAGSVLGMVPMLALALVFFPGASALAATFEGLYTVNVSLRAPPPFGEVGPGAPQTRISQTEATRIAMGRLLTRITGRPDAGLELIFLNLLDQAPRFVLEVGRLDRDTLTVTFDSLSLERELRALDQPVWGPERPLTLLWVAVDAGLGQRDILSAEQNENEADPVMAELKETLRQELLGVADERGLPVTLPLLDLQDMRSLTFADIWGGFNDRVRQASERYQADAILVGRVRATQFGATGQWTLLRGGTERVIATTTPRDGLDRLAAIFAADFSAVGGARVTRIAVENVARPEDYFKVLSYMESLSLLDTVDVEQIDSERLLLRVASRGDLSVLERTLSLGDVLTPVAAPTFESGTIGTTLTFRLSDR